MGKILGAKTSTLCPADVKWVREWYKRRGYEFCDDEPWMIKSLV
jgi:hypothetical protein